MAFRVSDDHGYLTLGDFCLTWGNAVNEPELRLDGFCSIAYKDFSLEFGDLDQGRPGVYLNKYADGEVSKRRTIWQAA